MNQITFGSVCSGIEAASVAWHPLGWRAAWLAEIEPFPSAVLAHHYPDVPNLGDMTKLAAMIRAGQIQAPDVFCGGTPCQAFSVAGLRRSLDDARGNLSLTFCEIANELDAARSAAGKPAATIFWENVPGVLNTKDNAFGCFLAGLAGEADALQPPRGRWANAGAVFGPARAVAWRVLDAQFFGVAQRRRRVFVVASARDGFDPAAVLFEWDGVRRDTAPRRQAREGVANCLTDRPDRGGGNSEGQRLIASGNAEGSAGLPFLTCSNIGKTVNNQTPPMAFSSKDHSADASQDLAPTLRAMGHAGSHANGGGQMAVAFPIDTQNMTEGHASGGLGFGQASDPSFTLTKGHSHAVATAMQVRRLTPRECERLQGFADDYTLIPWRKKPASECPDGPRYKALGNSWAVPNVRWIGQRIDAELRRLDAANDNQPAASAATAA